MKIIFDEEYIQRLCKRECEQLAEFNKTPAFDGNDYFSGGYVLAKVRVDAEGKIYCEVSK